MKSSVKNISARRVWVSTAFAVGCMAVGAQGSESRVSAPIGFSQFTSAPLYFEQNAGQFGDGSEFVARGSQCTVLLAPAGAKILLGKNTSETPVRQESVLRVVSLNLVNANSSASMAGREEIPAKANYFLGNDSSKWQRGVPLFSRVQVSDVYPGVQVVYYANQSAQLEYDFLLQPAAQPEQVRFRVEGADRVQVSGAGNLSLKIGPEEIQQHKPVAYQEKGGVRQEVAANYHLNADGTVGFQLGEYDHTLPLVIDPVLDFVTYIGGKKLDIGWAITLDAANNIYVAGETLSETLPTLNPIQFGTTNFAQFHGGNHSFGDAFVAKYDNSGVLRFLTYLGGKTDDGALGIAYDPTGAGSVWVTGFTDSTNFPLVNPMRDALTGPNKNAKKVFAPDAFLARLDLTGETLLYSTLFGGENIDEGVGLAVDASGGVYLTGLTGSTNLTGLAANSFQTIPGGNMDAFVAKIVPIAENIYTNAYTSFLGGTNVEYGLSIAVDSGLDAWVTGLTFSTNFFTTNALQLPPGVSLFFTNGITFTNLNAQPMDEQRKKALRSDAFITEFSPDGTTVPFSTFLGGTNDDAGERIVIDRLHGDKIFVTGYTLSRDFPTNRITVLPVPPGITNEIVVYPNMATNFLAHVFVTEITSPSSPSLGFSTHFGGSVADLGVGAALDDNGLLYVTGSAGSTNLFPSILMVTNFTTSIKHGVTVTNYFGILTNSPVFANLSSTNETVKLKHKGNTNDVFVAVLSAETEFTNFLHAIVLGGPGQDEANGIAVDHDGGAVYLVGSTTSATNFATTNAAQPIFGGPKNSKISDAFVGKIQIVPVP